jgi:hypothetical protein
VLNCLCLLHSCSGRPSWGEHLLPHLAPQLNSRTKHYFMVSHPNLPMIKMRLHILRFAFIATTAFIFASRSQASDNCKAGFTLCAPPGATSETTPQIGTLAFQDLYEDIVFSSLPPSSKSSSSTSAASLCCTTSLSCVLMVDLEIPFCYDRFTTNYFLPDGSYGTVASIPRLPNRPFKRHASHNLASCAVSCQLCRCFDRTKLI